MFLEAANGVKVKQETQTLFERAKFVSFYFVLDADVYKSGGMTSSGGVNVTL